MKIQNVSTFDAAQQAVITWLLTDRSVNYVIRRTKMSGFRAFRHNFNPATLKWENNGGIHKPAIVGLVEDGYVTLVDDEELPDGATPDTNTEYYQIAGEWLDEEEDSPVLEDEVYYVCGVLPVGEQIAALVGKPGVNACIKADAADPDVLELHVEPGFDLDAFAEQEMLTYGLTIDSMYDDLVTEEPADTEPTVQEVEAEEQTIQEIEEKEEEEEEEPAESPVLHHRLDDMEGKQGDELADIPDEKFLDPKNAEGRIQILKDHDIPCMYDQMGGNIIFRAEDSPAVHELLLTHCTDAYLDELGTGKLTSALIIEPDGSYTKTENPALLDDASKGVVLVRSLRALTMERPYGLTRLNNENQMRERQPWRRVGFMTMEDALAYMPNVKGGYNRVVRILEQLPDDQRGIMRTIDEAGEVQQQERKRKGVSEKVETVKDAADELISVITSGGNGIVTPESLEALIQEKSENVVKTFITTFYRSGFWAKLVEAKTRYMQADTPDSEAPGN